MHSVALGMLARAFLCFVLFWGEGLCTSSQWLPVEQLHRRCLLNTSARIKVPEDMAWIRQDLGFAPREHRLGMRNMHSVATGRPLEFPFCYPRRRQVAFGKRSCSHASPRVPSCLTLGPIWGIRPLQHHLNCKAPAGIPSTPL